MKLLTDLLATEPGRDIVARSKAGQGMRDTLVAACIIAACCGFLYGFAMGIGVSLSTAWKDGIKVVIVLAGTYGITMLPLLLVFRVAERSVRSSIVTLSALMGWIAASVVLGVTAPFCFLAGILWEEGGKLAQVIVVDIAILFGLYVMGLLFFRNADVTDKRRLAVPAAIGLALILLATFLLIQFLSPFLEDVPFFSRGTEKLIKIFSPGHRIHVANSCLFPKYVVKRIDGEPILYHPEQISGGGEFCITISPDRRIVSCFVSRA